MPFALLILIVGTALLAAGRPAGIIQATAILSSLPLIFSRAQARTRCTFILWWTGCVTLLAVFITTLPISSPLLDDKRENFFPTAAEHSRNVHELTSKLKDQNARAENPTTSDSTSVSRLTRHLSGQETPSFWMNKFMRPRHTLNRTGTLRLFFLFAGAFAIFWISADFNLQQRRRFLTGLTIFGAILVLCAIMDRWLFPVAHYLGHIFPLPSQANGIVFVNRNHFAAFCALLAPLALALALMPGLSQFLSSRSDFFSNRTENSSENRRILTRLAGLPHQSSRGNIVFSKTANKKREKKEKVFCVIFIMIMLFFIFGAVSSLSRGGIIVTIGGIFITALLAVRLPPLPATVTAFLAITVMYTVMFFPSALLQERLDTLKNLRLEEEYRHEMWTVTYRIWRQNPIFGTGGESLRTLYSHYEQQPGDKTPLYCENEYIQTLAELGLVGFILLAANFFLLLLSILCVNSPKKGISVKNFSDVTGTIRRAPMPLLAAGGGVITVFVSHSFIDFPFRVPLNTYLLAAVLGCLMPLPSDKKKRRASSSQHTDFSPQQHFGSNFHKSSFLVFSHRISCLLLALLITGLGWLYRGERIASDDPDFLAQADTGQLTLSLLNTPSFWYVYYLLGHDLIEKSQTKENISPEVSYQLYRRGALLLYQAAEYRPQSIELWRRMALWEEEKGQLPKARKRYRHLTEIQPANSQRWREWFAFENKYATLEEAQKVADKAGQNLSSEQIMPMIIEIARAWEKKQNYQQALHNYSRIMEASNDFDIWRKTADLTRKVNGKACAAETWEKMTEKWPEKWRTWWELAKIELELGNSESANRAFNRAVRLKPELRSEADRLWDLKHLDHDTPF